MLPSLYRHAKFEAKASGAVVADGREVGHTKQCPHCSGHFLSLKGSRIKRHYCPVCKKVTCGQAPCAFHFLAEHKLEAMEAKERNDRATLERLQRHYPDVPIISA